MAKELLLEVVTPDRKVLSENVEYVGAPGIEGEFGIMANHIPFLSALGIGNLYYKQNGKTYYLFIAGGFAEVSSNTVTVLAEVAEKAAEIDVEKARRARERAQKRMREQFDRIEFARAEAEMRRALARMTCRNNAEGAGTCSM